MFVDNYNKNVGTSVFIYILTFGLKCTLNAYMICPTDIPVLANERIR